MFGLIVGGQFQDPWRDAAWVTASTHKTFPGPQRGVIVADLDEENERKYWPSADRGVFPGCPVIITSTPCQRCWWPSGRCASMPLPTPPRLSAMRKPRDGRSDDEGIQVEARDFGYTRVIKLPSMWRHMGEVVVAQRLEANDIVVNYNLLPRDTEPRNPSGLRIGVQEMTRYGMREDACNVSPGCWLMPSRARRSPTLCMPCARRTVLYST